MLLYGSGHGTGNCGCLVTWFCYQLIAKPGNKTATVPWPDPYIHVLLLFFFFGKWRICTKQTRQLVSPQCGIIHLPCHVYHDLLPYQPWISHNGPVCLCISLRCYHILAQWLFHLGPVCPWTEITDCGQDQPLKCLICWQDVHNLNDKQRVLMHGHQGWNVRHGLCHIYMIYVYIWVVYSFCLFCCLFIIVTTQFVALYKPCKPKPKPSTYDPPDNHPLAEIQRPILRPEPKQQICHQHANTDHCGK